MTETGPADFLTLAARLPVIDVRSPAEYEQGHMPGAINLPLFSNEERAQVGTLYKNTGRSEAFDLGLDIVGPKMSGFVKMARNIAPRKEMLVHCWRGGMRSASMGWLLESAGYRVTLLKGGYKAYRTHIRENLLNGRKFIILGGMTGSGKTRWLKELKQSGEPVIDLEKLANHRGSVFGGIGLGQQPTNEQFENDLYRDLDAFDHRQVIWLEDESRQIGRIFMPEALYLVMTVSPMIRVWFSEEFRVSTIIDEYAGLDTASLADSITRISKRLGGLVTSQCLDLLANGDFAGVVRLLLPYYDKTYNHSVERRNRQLIAELDLTREQPESVVRRIAEKKYQLIQ